MTRDPIFDLAEHVATTGYDTIPAEAVASAKTFILDTLGVGISGANGPMAAELRATLATAGQGADGAVWGTDLRLPAQAAAQCNAYQAHCQEYDCVHEAAVAHVLTVVLPSVLAVAERDGGVTGRRLIEAVVLGVDVAAGLGVAATSGLRFFRPGTVGAFGGVAAVGKVLGFDATRLVEGFSLAYGQVGGTMQAHTEGSGLLAMQMGFNARNAVAAADLAAAGFTGPHNILTGDFGYFRLIEDGGDPEAMVADLGRLWRITEVAHKPFPSGRATHGILDGCLALQREDGFAAEQVESIRLTVPPLIQHLVGRPPKEEMAINYARLCTRYVLACALHGGGVALSDFTPEAYRRGDRQALAARTELVVKDDGDPNALVPIGIEIRLADGRALTRTVEHVYGAPSSPMSRDAQLGKLRENCVDQAQAEALAAAVDLLEEMVDVRELASIAARRAA